MLDKKLREKWKRAVMRQNKRGIFADMFRYDKNS